MMSRRPKRARTVHWTVQSWERGLEYEDDPDVPVWISIAKFDALWRQTDQYIAHAGGADDNQPGKYARAGQWIGSNPATWMPFVVLNRDGAPDFVDGRHRYLWMREHGAWSMPVAVSAGDAWAVQALCGTRYRTSWYVPPGTGILLPAILAGIGLAAVGLLVVARL